MKIGDLKKQIAHWPDECEVKVKFTAPDGPSVLLEIAHFGGYTSDWIPENSRFELVVKGGK